MVLEATTRVVFPTLVILSIYLFFAGHNAPGGGFAGGLVMGLALVLRYLAGGRYELGEALPVEAGTILGAGLLVSATTAVTSLFLGAPALSSAVIDLELPVFGSVHIVTALFFDLGIYLIVVGLVLDVLRSLGARLETPDDAPAPEPSEAVK
ncbi:MAG: Na+/H+ antiporter subunit A, partial [Gordonia sp. (in: high G+C Gram-positive bacteria)]|jgi:multicomponent Na+:H+ antiporter subunit A|nr:Na+/H+ antiporter subunit A [Gordonia sp. (in: high G+C Gram-positive bacteria)]